MNSHRSTPSLWAALILAACIPAANAFGDEAGSKILRFGGCGGVHFLADPGEFWVELTYKAHRNRGNTFVRVLLAGPDRSVLHDEYLSTSESKPERQTRIQTNVPARGVYVLNITMPTDRYGTKAAWGFQTNARDYLVETSRGHRDAAHEEPLDLRSPGVPGDVCFRPEREPFAIEITGYPADQKPPEVFDAAGRAIATLTPSPDGNAQVAVSADVPRGATPWRLHLPSFEGQVHIDGVTRWPRNSDYPDFSLWTPQLDAWFPLHKNRWLIAPYHLDIYTGAGNAGTAEFELHNNAGKTRTFHVAIEYPNAPWPVELAAPEVTAPAGDAAPVTLSYTPPGAHETRVCRVRVTPEETPEISTYATLRLLPGAPPAAKPLDLPLVLEPYKHENAQFGYLPGYPLTNQVYFNRDNAPFITSRSSLFQMRGDSWEEARETGTGSPFRLLSSKVAFDRGGNLYLVGNVEGAPALLHASAGAMALQRSAIPGRGRFDIEQFSGHNTPGGPPPLVRYTQTAADPDLKWRRINNLDLLLPERDADGGITFAEPVRVSEQCIGFSAHSGIPSAVVSREGKVHVAWGEATNPEENAPGVPTYAATYDRASGTLSAPTLIGHGPPANDVHNTPCITMDSQGYLHVLVGTHGRTFKYARSLQPNTAAAGWTEAEDLGRGLRQTYVGLVCGPDDTLHCVFRLWRDDRQYFPASHYATLAYMRKPPGEPWSEPRLLVVAAFSDYSIFYHRLTIDRTGRLFLSYDYWSTYWFYRNERRGNRCALMLSPDGGDTWRLATAQLLRP